MTRLAKINVGPGQTFDLSMLGKVREPALGERLPTDVVEAVLAAGWRTADIAAPGCQIVGTRRMGGLISEAACERLAGGPTAANR